MPLMSAADAKLFRRAFELAYFIHPYKNIALGVAESAMHKLDHSFGRQGRRAVYMPSGRRQGHETPARVIRTKVSLREEHLLQVLVYAESEPWESSSEQGAGSHHVTEEDMVIRFIKHLVQITVRRNSFYVTLGLGRLLYEYNTSQVRQMYDVLMQDHARFRDNSYLRRQKNLLIQELLHRFNLMIRTITTSQREERFQTQPTTAPLLQLVRECLIRFTPWDTTCVFPEKDFDPVGKIPALSFTGSNPDDEAPVEITRIHTITHPDCFVRLAASLGFPAPDEVLAVPQFFISADNETRGDRFNPPPVPEAQDAELKQSRAERARRRKTFRPGIMRVYVDDVETISLDPRQTDTVKFKISNTAKVIEVRGEDAKGELALGTLAVPFDEIPAGGLLRDSLTLEGGQKLTIALESQPAATEEPDEFNVEICYTETRPLRALAWRLRRAELPSTDVRIENEREEWTLRPAYAWLLGIIGVVLVVTLFLIWQQRRVREAQLPGRQVEIVPTPVSQISPEPIPSRSPERPQNPPIARNAIAHITWNNDANAVGRAIRIEVRRGGAPAIEIFDPATLLLAVNRASADDERYRRYRFTLVAQDRTLWEQTLTAPIRANVRAHVLNLELATRQLPAADAYKLRVDGEAQSGWENLGELILTPKPR